MSTHNLIARTRLLLDGDWAFHLGEIPPPALHGHEATYYAAKAGGALGAARPDFPDADWRRVDLPHDWAVEQPFDPGENSDHGYRPTGVAWYRRKFRLPEADDGRCLTLEFDGVAIHCTVWLNGQLLHRHWCGYTGFAVDLSDVAYYGERPNTLVVRVDATPFEGWWYEGAGMYRHVWLVKTARVHVARHGVWVNPVKGPAGWDTRIETTVENTGLGERTVEVASTLLAPDGTTVGVVACERSVPAGESLVVRQRLPVDAPRLWSLEETHLYVVHTEIREEGQLIDDTLTPFGYREIAFDADRGFLLNGQPVKLLGTCNHQDHAGVGVAVPDALQEFRIARLKAMGANAYRCAHNPPASALLDACDRLGMLVMDENRHFNTAPEYLGQLREMVLRDRNHPSVILWSVFNEETWQGTPNGRKMVETMRREIRKLDPSRPVTAAMSGGILAAEGAASALDVMGINYNLHTYDDFRAAFPGKPITASENECAFTTRGVYESDARLQLFASYDEEAAPWGATARQTWKEIAARPFIAGLFVWTGFDYRGEPSPYEWPSINSHWGLMDTCGFAKDAFHLHRAWWTREPMAHLLPHWNWPGREGQPIRVQCYTNGDRAELYLNDRGLGIKKVDPLDMVEWMVPFEPGSLKVVVFREGKVIAKNLVETTGEPVALFLEPDRAWLHADGEDAVPVTVGALDARGRRVPTANQFVFFDLEGDGRILGVGNGDPNCHEPDNGRGRSLFNGLCQVILGSGVTPGALTLTASSPGLRPCALVLPLRPAARRPFVPAVTEALLVGGWRLSPLFAERPDPRTTVADHDVNTWTAVEPGSGPSDAFAQPGFAIYRATFTPPAPGTLSLGAVVGTAELYLDGRCVARKDDPVSTDIDVECPAGEPITLSLLVYSDAGFGGITGLATYRTAEPARNA